MMTQDSDILTSEVAVGLLRVSSKTVLALARDVAHAGAKVDRAWRFLRADLLDSVHRGSGHDIERRDVVA